MPRTPIILVLLGAVLVSLFAVSAAPAWANVGESCCGLYNKFLPGEIWYPKTGGKLCTTSLSLDQIRDALNKANFCVAPAHPLLLFFCNISGLLPEAGLPTACTGYEELCDVSKKTCQRRSEAVVEVTDPSCRPGCAEGTVVGNVDPSTWGKCYRTNFLGLLQYDQPCQKDFCGAEGKYIYDLKTGKCNRVPLPIRWNPNKTSCGGAQGIETAIGCIPTDKPEELLKFVLRWAFFASGGIILLMIIATGYTVLTSSGNPEKLQGAKENVVSIFSGLILIAFSLILLQTIGVDILNLPGFK